MSTRVFVVDIEPIHPARWEVWVSEEPYRGVDTDAALPGQRQKIGSSWTTRRLVGTRATEWGARRMGRDALRTAERRAATHQAERQAQERFAAQNKSIRMTTTPTTSPEQDESTEAQA